jgi:hypothetical protein
MEITIFPVRPPAGGAGDRGRHRRTQGEAVPARRRAATTNAIRLYETLGLELRHTTTITLLIRS